MPKLPPAKSRWRLTEKPKRRAPEKPESPEERRDRIRKWLYANHPDIMRRKLNDAR
jgi:hypothetical protein